MSATSTSNPLPKPALYGVGAVVAFTLIAVFFGRSEGVGLTELLPGVAVSSVAFGAEDQVDGSIVMRDAASGRVIGTVRPGEDGFIRGTLRGLAQSRQRAGLGREAPFRLTRFEDGRLALEDGATGRTVALEAFGPTNAGAFARFLPADPPKEARAGALSRAVPDEAESGSSKDGAASEATKSAAGCDASGCGTR